MRKIVSPRKLNFEDDYELKSDIELDIEEKRLWEQLKELHSKLREYTKKKYNRINPFVEDLFDWKEKGTFWGGKNVTIFDSATVTGNVVIGDNTWIGPFCSIDGTGGLEIGRFCVISSGTRIVTHDTVKSTLSEGKCKYEYSPVVVGDCTFIGVNSVVLRGSTIGNHCVIGASSLVNRSFEDFSIVAGVPAKKIGEVLMKNHKVVLKYLKPASKKKSRGETI